MRSRIREVKEIIDIRIKSGKILMKRKYHDGDIVEFDFEPNSIDIYWYDITLIGVITGVLYEKDGIHYKVQLRDNKRKIFGDLVVPEGAIKGIIEDNIIIVKCDFCGELNRVDRDKLKVAKKKEGVKEWGEELEKWGKELEEWEKELEKSEEWEKFYCLGKEHHILNMCSRCADNVRVDVEQEKCKCPYDHCTIISEQKKKDLEDHGIKLVDKI